MENRIDMNEIVGKYHILFICIDCLRYDVAIAEEEEGGTVNLNRYGKWEKRQAPGNFTYPSHQAMFAGFLPISAEVKNMKKRETLFFSENIGMGRKTPEGAFRFYGPNIVKGLEKVGYETYCIGGVSFFDNRSDIGKVFPSFFKHHDWRPAFGPKIKESATYQMDVAKKRVEQCESDKIFMYLNISALHYPNYFYVEGEKKDSVASQRAALRYVDKELGRLFEAFRKRGNTFVICLADHGTCYGEDGVWYHGINHPNVLTVPYKHFIL